MLQAIATGYLPDIEAGRRVVAASFARSTYFPVPDARWQAAFLRFSKMNYSG